MEGLKIIGTTIVTFVALYFTFQKNDKDKLTDKLEKKADKQEMTDEIRRLHERIDKKADESAMCRMESKIEAIYNRLINDK